MDKMSAGDKNSCKNLASLNEDSLLLVSKWLKPSDLARLSAVNKYIRGVITSANHLWFEHCWELIGLNWSFIDDLPVKKEEESYMKYFFALAEMVRIRYPFDDTSSECRMVKIGREIWTPVRDFQFQANVWRVIYGAADVAVGKRGDSQVDNFMKDVICYERNHVLYPEIHQLEKLPDHLAKDFYNLAYPYYYCGYGFDFEQYSSPLERSLRSSLLVENTFRQEFKNIPPHCRNFQMLINHCVRNSDLMVICLLTTELLSDSFYKLVRSNEIPFHSVCSIIQETALISTNQCLPEAEQRDATSFSEIVWKSELFESLCRQPAADVLRKIVAAAMTSFNALLERKGLNIPLDTTEEFFKRLMNIYIENYSDDDDDDDDEPSDYDVDCYFVFCRNYLKLHLQKNGETVFNYIRKFLFETNDSSPDSEPKKVASWILTDSDRLDGTNDHESEAVRMFVNDTRAVVIWEHVDHC